MESLPLHYKGSVKDVLGPVHWDSQSAFVFQYTDAFSVFDWGRMPDQIPGKGAALAVMSAHFFEKLENPESWQAFSRTPEAMALRRGISDTVSAGSPIGSLFNELGESLQKSGLKTHYLGAMPNGRERPVELKDLPEPCSRIAVKKINVVPPRPCQVLGKTTLNYQPTRAAEAPKLIPLEIVFRFGCPAGSSLIKKIAKDPDFLSTLLVPKEILAQKIEAGVKWNFPIVELFTKLEPTDRRVSFTEALAMGGLSSEQLQTALLKTIWIAGYLKAAFGKIGIELADGKLEWAIDQQGECILVDGIGPDELRLLSGSMQLSKEFLRKFYRTSSWAKSLETAQREAHARGQLDWKTLVKEPVPTLPAAVKGLASQIYLSIANEVTGRDWFPRSLSVAEVVKQMQELEARWSAG